MYFSEKKVHLKYTSFVLPEKKYKLSTFGKCTSSILLQTSVLVKNSFAKKSVL